MINLVNGYVCHNCTDIDYAKKGIDPAHPKKDDPLNAQTKPQDGIASAGKTVILSGALAKLDRDARPASEATNQHSPATGAQLNISV
jgi:hypothetical protein